MSTRISIAITALCTTILGCLTGIGTAAAAQPTQCTVFFFDVSLGQGVEAFCDSAPGTYQAIVQCSDDLDFWSVPGTLASAGGAPSVAVCHGQLLFPAHVVSYFVVQ